MQENLVDRLPEKSLALLDKQIATHVAKDRQLVGDRNKSDSMCRSGSN